MTLKRKKRFFHQHWFWCLLHGIDIYHLNRLSGDFMRHTLNCVCKIEKDVKQALSNLK